MGFEGPSSVSLPGETDSEIWRVGQNWEEESSILSVGVRVLDLDLKVIPP